MYTVYKHECPNGKAYIGMTSLPVHRRWNNGNGYKKQVLFYRAIDKYGWDSIIHTIIADNLSKEQAENLEKELIEKYNSTNPEYGYNCTLGGDGGQLGISPNSETRAKLAEATRHSWEERDRHISMDKLNKAVDKYDLEGNLISTYKSVKEAMKDNNCYGVSSCCKRKQMTCKGFVYRWHGDHFDAPTKYVTTEEHRKNLSEAGKRRFSDPNERMEHKERARRNSEKIRKALTELWKDEEYREKMLKARRKLYTVQR